MNNLMFLTRPVFHPTLILHNAIPRRASMTLLNYSITHQDLEPVLKEVNNLEYRTHRLTLVVGPPQSGKTAFIRKLADTYQAPVLNLNQELVQALLDVPVRLRPLKALEFTKSLITRVPHRTVFLDPTEIIFEPDLKLNPLNLLRDCSRNKTLVATWNGQIDDHYLIFSEPNYPDYCRYPLLELKDILIIKLIS